MNRFIPTLSCRSWLCVAVFNFLLVALMGLLMRLKFLYSISWIDQKNIMHAHSHFAFTAWVSMALMVFMPMLILSLRVKEKLPLRYQMLLLLNLVCSLCMMVAFSLQGYAFFSILFSTLSLFIGYFFCYYCWKDLNLIELPANLKLWYKVALLASILSSLGTYFLVYLKVTQQADPLKQLASIYFYLHFQYNGWFIFGCMAVFNHWLFQQFKVNLFSSKFHYAYAATLLPAYFLSVLWWKGMPSWLYVLLVMTVLLQLGLWLFYAKTNLAHIKKQTASVFRKPANWMFLVILTALTLKLLLQAVSVIPALSELVYGFKPIVIAYLHLVLLVIISMFILAFAFQQGALSVNRMASWSMLIICIGVFLNESLLAVQGIGGLIRVYIDGTHQGLLLAAVIMSLGILLLLISQLPNLKSREIRGSIPAPI